ncbi:aminotransferase class V-fold PLP-dependent enzyme [Shigella flexneri]
MIDAEARFIVTATRRCIVVLIPKRPGDRERMENVRKRASLFINAESAEELVFVRGNEGIDLVSGSAGATSNVRAGDNIIIIKWSSRADVTPWADALCTRWRRAACDPF